MENNTVLWITIAAYIICLVVIGIVEGRKAKSIADLTVGGRNAGAWLSALSYGTAYFSAVMFVGYAGKTGLSFGLWGRSCRSRKCCFRLITRMARISEKNARDFRKT